MNIFVLDKDPRKAAEFHCDKHCVKMILEAGQMLCVAHWFGALKSVSKNLKDFQRIREAKAYAVEHANASLIPPWTLTHTGHPCTVWTSENTGNYEWHIQLMRGLLDEYTRRYGKVHKSEEVYHWLSSRKPYGISKNLMTEHPQCMPDECKVFGDPVQSYRNYYNKYKAYMAKWKLGNVPHWYKGNQNV